METPARQEARATSGEARDFLLGALGQRLAGVGTSADAAS